MIKGLLLRRILWLSAKYVFAPSVITLALGFWAIHWDATKRWVLAQASGYADEAGVEISAESFSYNLWAQTIDLSGLTITTKGERQPFASIGRLSAHYHFTGFEKLNLSLVRELSLDHARVHIRRDAHGKWNLPNSSMGRSSDPGLPLRISISELEFAYEDAGGNRLELPGLVASLADGKWTARMTKSTGYSDRGRITRLEASGKLERLDLAAFDATGQFAMSDVRLGVGEPLAAVSSNFKFSGAEQTLRLADFQLRSKRGQVSGSATIPFDGRRQSEAVFRAGAEGVEAEGTASWTSLRWDTLRGNARLVSSRRDVRGWAEVTFDRGRATAHALSASHRFGDATGEVSVTFPNFGITGRLAGRLRNLSSAQGSVAFRAELSGTVQDPKIQALVESPSLGFGDIRSVDLRAQLDYKSSRLRIGKATLGWRGQRADGSGEVQFLRNGDAALDMSWSGPSIDLSMLTGNPELAGLGNLTLNVSGTLAQPATEGSVDGASLRVYGEDFGEWAGSFASVGAKLDVRSLRVAKGSGSVTGKGTLDTGSRTYQAGLVSEGLRIEDFARIAAFTPDWHGGLALRIEGRGSLDDPRASASLQAGDGIEATAALDSQGVTYALSAQAGLTLEPRPGLIVAGKPQAKGRLLWNDPEASPTDIRIADLAVQTAGHMVRASAVHVAVSGGQLSVQEPVTLDSEGAQLVLKGSLPLRPGTGTGESKIAVDGEAPLALTERHLDGVHWTGRARIRGEIGGSLQGVKPRLTAEVKGAALNAPELLRGGPVREIDAVLQFDGDRVTMERFSAALPSGTLRGGGWLRYDRAKPPSLEWNGAFEAVDAAALFRRPGLDPPWTSRISGEVRVEADAFRTIQDLRAAGRLTEFRIQAPPVAAAQTSPAEFDLQQGVLTVRHLEVESQEGKFGASGSVGLMGDQTLNLKVGGKLDAGLLMAFAQRDNAFLAGPVDAALTVTGTLTVPQVKGDVHWSQGRLALLLPTALSGDGIDVNAEFRGSEVRIPSMRASLNGSPVRGSGTLSLGPGPSLSAVDLKFSGKGLFLDFPKGLQTASDFDIQLKSERDGPIVAGGRILVLDGAYREGMNLASMATSLLTAPAKAAQDSTGMLSRMRYNIAIETQRPITVDNNLGRLTADAALRLVGPVANPSLTGRFEIEEGSRVYFAGRTFQVNQGIVDFTDETRIAPRFNLEAESTISSYLLTLKLSGDPGHTETALTSDPALSEDQVRSLLLTGNPDSTGNYGALAQTQALSLFGSGVAGSFTTLLRNKIGLSEFRIDPSLISADKDPTARLTIGQNLTPELRIAYSTNLTNAQDQIWSAEYDWRRRFLARFFRETNQNNRLELRHKLRFGGGENAGDTYTRALRTHHVLRNIAIDGNTVFDRDAILRAIKLRPGQRYEFLRSQAALDRLRAFYAKNGYWQARVYQERSNAAHKSTDNVDLTLHVDASRPVRFVYEGANIPKAVQHRVGRIWQDSIIDAQRLGAASREIQEHLMRRGYLSAEVRGTIRENQETRVVVLDILRGSNYGLPHVTFPGLPAALALDLQFLLLRTGLDRQGRTNPKAVTAAVSEHLKGMGYLAATVETPIVATPDVNDMKRKFHRMRVTIPVATGPLFTLGALAFSGANAIPDDRLRIAAGVASGDRYLAGDQFEIALRVERAYWNQGFRSVRVVPDEALDAQAGKANVTLRIEEGASLRAGEIHIEGRSSTSENFVRKRLAIAPGEPLSAESISRSRRNLLDSNAYNRIDITYGAARRVNTNTGSEIADIDVAVREPKPYRLDLGGTYDTDRGIGLLADLSAINLFGEARTLGIRATLDGQKQDFRVYFNQPFLGSQRLLTTATVFRTLEKIRSFDTDLTGVSLQQNWRIRPRWNLSYGYQLELATVSIELPELGSFSLSGRSSAVVSTLSYESRDAVLDASQGMFFSTAAEYGPSMLGGSLPYYKAYWQGSKYFGLSKPKPMPFDSTGTRRPRFVYATNARIGVSNTLGSNELLPTDRFFAGGGTSVRGYAQNSIGPVLSDNSPSGGKATLIFNNELRFPVFGPIDGVPFLDAGNIWSSPSGLSLRDLRAGAGFGIRIRNPLVLLRFDYGWKIGRRPGESPGAFFFSIGQAF